MTRPLFLSWVGQHGRSTGLAEAFGAECVFVSGASRLPTPARYAHHALWTALLLARRRPAAVVVMLPPFPLLVVVAAYARLTGARVIGDLHSGVFNNPQWAWALRPTLTLLRRHLALVTTTAIQRRCEAAHVRTLVLHDLLVPLPPGGAAPAAGPGPTVLFPASYYADEPLDALL
ncbi:MAG: glycosyltransferase, partial [Frankiales bacterium]|nr:glycosyltransferase [Frankiales bacterium]